MRIAVAVGGTDRGRSGISTYVRALLPRLQAGLEAEGGQLIAFGGAEDLATYEGELRRAETAVTCNRGPGLDAAWHLLRAGAFAEKLGADVLLLPAANRRLTAFSRVPTVAVVHDLAQLKVPEKFDPLRMFYATRVLPGALRTATELVAVSEATRRDLCGALHVKRERIRLVPNGVDAARFLPASGDDDRIDRARVATGLVGPYLLYMSRLEHPGKNHLRLLRAFAGSAAARTHVLALAGADFGAAAAVRSEIARLHLGDRVSVLGFVADDLLPGLVAGADAVAMVGLYEGFGLPALEAIAAGRPVVASATGALPEVVGRFAAMCDPLSVGSISTALDRAIADPQLRASVAAEGPAWAAARGWDRTASGILDACFSARLQSRLPQPATFRVSN